MAKNIASAPSSVHFITRITAETEIGAVEADPASSIIPGEAVEVAITVDSGAVVRSAADVAAFAVVIATPETGPADIVVPGATGKLAIGGSGAGNAAAIAIADLVLTSTADVADRSSSAI